MDFRNIECVGSKCKDKGIVMRGAGATFGGRIEHVKVKCPECDLMLLIIPMHKEYEYSISATTEEERINDRIKKATEKSELELAKTINTIKETGY